jgi:hypothetical protein
MSPTEPTPQISRLILQHGCPKCFAPMALTRINPDEPGREIRTFSCPKCAHSETKVFGIL